MLSSFIIAACCGGQSVMMSVEERMAMLSARIDREAWLRLQQFRHQPNFAELLEHLERTDGTVREADVNHAARLFLDNREDQTSSRS
jgi:hypothetical protein